MAKKATPRKAGTGTKASKTSKPRRAAKSTTRSTAGKATKSSKASTKKKTARKSSSTRSTRKTSSRKATPEKATTRKATSPKATSRKATPSKATSTKATSRKTASRKASPSRTAAPKTATRRKTAPSRRNGTTSGAVLRKKSIPVPAAEPGATGPGPRMLQVLQAEMIAWDRENLSHEDAQLQELEEIPVRNMYGAEEARRRLLDRQTVSPAKRRLRSRTTSSS